MDLEQQKIVITGGPSTGKTCLIEALEKTGYRCFPEVIRLMTLEAKETGTLSSFTTNPIASVKDPLDFNRKILSAREAHYKEASLKKEGAIFFDRGIPDVLAYMEYFGQTYGSEFLESAHTHRYDTIFILPIWKEIYVVDNERFESFDEALAIHDHLWESYSKLGYKVIEVPMASITARVDFIVKTLHL